MSEEIDRRIVEMRFDNEQFERGIHQSMKSLDEFEDSLKFEDSSKGFEKLGSAADKLASEGLNKVAIATSEMKHEFSAMEAVAFSALQNLTNKAINFGERLIKSVTIDQVTAGYSKYEEKVKSVQTIMASTGKDIDSVSKSLDRLNWYTDETSASFSDMINNIGKFTSNNIDLDDAISATEGIANWAMLSGQSNSTASRAYYNLAQALSLGSVQLMDWRSIQNANMATTEFKQNVLETATQMGMLEEVSEGVYRTTSLTAKAGEEVTNMNFTNALTNSKWFSSDVLLKVLKRYGDFSDRLNEATAVTDMTASEIIRAIDDYKKIDEGVMTVAEWNNTWRSKVGSENLQTLTEYMEEFAHATDEAGNNLYDIGIKSFKAAQEAKSFSDAASAIKDAVSTQFMNLYETIFGNYEEAKKLWTDVANWGYDIFAGPLSTLNEYFELVFGDTNNLFSDLADNLSDLGVSTEQFERSFVKIFNQKNFGENSISEGIFSDTERLKDILNSGFLSGSTLSEIIDDAIGDTGVTVEKAKEAKESFEEVKKVVYDIIRGDYGNQPVRSNLLEQAGYEYEKYQALVNKVWNGGSYDGVITADDIADMNDEVLKAVGLSEEEIDNIREFSYLARQGDESIQGLLDSLSMMSGREMLTQTLENIMQTIKNLAEIGSKVWEKLFPESKVSSAKKILNTFMDASSFILSLTEDTERISDNISYVLTPIANAGKLIKQIFGKVFDIVREVFKLFTSYVPNVDFSFLETFVYGSNIIYDILSSLISLIDPKEIASNIKNAFSFIKNIFTDIFAFFKSGNMFAIGDFTIQGFIEGIKSRARNIWDSVKEFFVSFVDKIKDFFIIASPSKLLFAIGAFVALGFINGIKKNLPKIKEIFNKFKTAIAGPLKDIESSLIGKGLSGKGNWFENFIGRLVLMVELGATKLGEAFRNLRAILIKNGTIKAVYDYIDEVKGIAKKNNGNIWNSFWDILSLNRSKLKELKKERLESARNWIASLYEGSFGEWLMEGQLNGSLIAETIAHVLDDLSIILDEDLSIKDKLKEISENNKEYTSIFSIITNTVAGIVKYLTDNIGLILDIAKLGVKIKALFEASKLIDSISYFFDEAKSTTKALTNTIESWSNPLARTGTITKKLSKSQAFAEIAKGILMIGASLYLISLAFEKVYNMVSFGDQAALSKTEGVIFGMLGALAAIISIIGIATVLIAGTPIATISGSVALNSIATAIKWIAILIGELVAISWIATKLSTGTLIGMGAIIVALTVFGSALIYFISKNLVKLKVVDEGKIQKATGAIVSIIALISALALIGLVFGIIGAISPKVLLLALATVSVLIGAVYVLLWIIRDFVEKISDKSIPNVEGLMNSIKFPLIGIIGIIVAIGAFVVAITIVAGNDIGKWLGAGAMLIIMTAAVYVIMHAVEKLYETISSSDKLASKDGWISLIVIFSSIIIMIVAIGIIMVALVKACGDDWKKYLSVGLLIGVIAGVVWVIIKAVEDLVRSMETSLKGKSDRKAEALLKAYIPIFAFVILFAVVLGAFAILMAKVCGSNWGQYAAAGLMLVALTGMVSILLFAVWKFVSSMIAETNKVNDKKLNSVTEALKSVSVLILAIGAVVLMIAAAVAIVAYSIKDAKNPWAILGYVGIILVAVIGTVIGTLLIIERLMKDDNFSSRDSSQLIKSVSIMIGLIGGLMLAIAASVYIISRVAVDKNVLLRSVLTIGGIFLVVLALISVTIVLLKESKEKVEGKKKVTNKDLSKSVMKVIGTVIALIIVITAAIYILSKIEKNELIKGAVTVAAVMTFLLVFIIALNKLINGNIVQKNAETGKSKKFNQVIKTVIPIIIGIIALCIAAIVLGGMDRQSLIYGVGAIAVLGLVIAAILGLVSLVMKNKKSGSAGKTLANVALMISVAGGLYFLAKAVEKLSSSEGDVWNGVKVMLALAGIMAVLAIVIGIFGAIVSKNGSFIKTLTTVALIIAVVGGLYFLAKAVKTLNNLKGDIWKGVKVMLALAGIMAVLAIVIGLVGAIVGKVGGIEGLAIIAIIGGVIIALSIAAAEAAKTTAIIVDAVASIIDNITKIVLMLSDSPDFFSGLEEKFNGDPDDFINNISKKVEVLIGAFLTIADRITEGIVNAFALKENQELVGSIISNIVEFIVSLASAIEDDGTIKSAVKTLCSTLLSEAVESIWDLVETIFVGLVAGIVKLVGKIPELVVKGLHGDSDAVSDYFDSLADEMISEMAGDLSTEIPVTVPEDFSNVGLIGLENAIPGSKDFSKPMKTDPRKFDFPYTETAKAAGEEASKDVVDAVAEGMEDGAEAEASGTDWTGILTAILDNVDLGDIGSTISGLMSEIKGIDFMSIDWLSLTNAFDEGSINIGAIVNALGLDGRSVEAGVNVIEGLIDGITDPEKKKELLNSISNLLGENDGGLLNYVKEALEEKSPSKATEEDGINLIKGLINGVNNPIERLMLKASILSLGNDVMSTFSEALTPDKTISYTPTVTPVIDFTTYDSQIASINADLVSPKLSVNGKAIGEISNMSGTITIVNDNHDIVSAVNSLNQKMDRVVSEMTGLKVVMDTGALVGQLSPKIDSMQGRRMAINKRNGG